MCPSTHQRRRRRRVNELQLVRLIRYCSTTGIIQFILFVHSRKLNSARRKHKGGQVTLHCVTDQTNIRYTRTIILLLLSVWSAAASPFAVIDHFVVAVAAAAVKPARTICKCWTGGATNTTHVHVPNPTILPSRSSARSSASIEGETLRRIIELH